MKTTLTELVDLIIERIKQHPDTAPTAHGLRSWLARQGYNKHDIEAVLKMVRPRFEALRHAGSCGPGAVRQLTAYEDYKLTPEARDALARLELYGLIEPYEREMLLDRLSQFEAEVGMDELDYLLSWLVYSSRDVESQQTIYDVFEGNKKTAH
ncbi:MAG TPA: DUF494 family protein [Candidatus Hydrogenedentes bacterium]|nr:DUF494 family protein [Candidatus Hydrogenedentota bacterium]HNT88421.1 DUF494 family protein [Candidatus Hydrogenedentota bacterium]